MLVHGSHGEHTPLERRGFLSTWQLGAKCYARWFAKVRRVFTPGCKKDRAVHFCLWYTMHSVFCTVFYHVSFRLWKKRHQCHQLYVLFGYEVISFKYMFASARKYFPPSLGYEFISINSINYTVVSAYLFVSASLRPGYEIILINSQTYLINNSQTDPLIVKRLPASPFLHSLHIICYCCIFVYSTMLIMLFEKCDSLTKSHQNDNSSH